MSTSERFNFFLGRKLNVYNLTEHCSLDETAYNAIRAEFVAGKGANEIAIALHVILSVILKDYPFVNWSESCIRQKRISVINLGLKIFMSQNTWFQKDSVKVLYNCHPFRKWTTFIVTLRRAFEFLKYTILSL